MLYRRFVFRVRGHVWRDLGRFELVNLGALAVNAALLPVFVEVFGFPVLAYLIITSIRITYGELVPKIYTVVHADRVGRRIARPLHFFRRCGRRRRRT